MTSVTQMMEEYQQLLNETVHDIGWETGAFQREGKLDAATFVQMMVFGYWQDPEMHLSDLIQIGGRREVNVSASAISQRMTAKSAEFFLEILRRLVAIEVQGEEVDIPLLKRFSAVIVEDSSTVTLPPELAEIWKGCGGSEKVSKAGIKVFTQWNVLTGAIAGPVVTDGRVNDHNSPFAVQDLPAGSLSLADLGFFAIRRLCAIAREKKDKEGKKQKRYFVTRLQAGTSLYHRNGHRLSLAGLLPQQVGEVRELGAVLGQKNGMAVRVILVKVPDEVAEDRKERLLRTAQKHGYVASEASLKMAHWTILLTNIPMKWASCQDILVLLRLRWQIERLFRLWKENGKIDEWSAKKPFGVLCELYAKLCAMVIQNYFIQEGCWHDPERSLVKAAACLRRECNRIMVAFYEGNLEKTVQSILRLLKINTRIDRRVAKPSTAQLLLNGLDWQLELLC